MLKGSILKFPRAVYSSLSEKKNYVLFVSCVVRVIIHPVAREKPLNALQQMRLTPGPRVEKGCFSSFSFLRSVDNLCFLAGEGDIPIQNTSNVCI